MLPLSEIGSHACAALLFRPCNQVEDRSYLFGRCLGIDNRRAVTEGPDVDDAEQPVFDSRTVDFVPKLVSRYADEYEDGSAIPVTNFSF